jgi:AcrR family transcriptional regulator
VTRSRSSAGPSAGPAIAPLASPDVEWSARRLELWEQLAATFLTEGFLQLTVGDLADRLSCSRRTLYLLADNRDDLVNNVVAQIFLDLEHAATDAVAGVDRAADAAAAHLAHGLVSLDARPVFLHDVAERSATARSMASWAAGSLAALTAVIEQGVRNRQLRRCEPAIVAEALEGAAERLARRRFEEPGAYTSDVVCDVLRTMAHAWVVER